jgi:hypothetical protein
MLGIDTEWSTLRFFVGPVDSDGDGRRMNSSPSFEGLRNTITAASKPAIRQFLLTSGQLRNYSAAFLRSTTAMELDPAIGTAKFTEYGGPYPPTADTKASGDIPASFSVLHGPSRKMAEERTVDKTRSLLPRSPRRQIHSF